MNRSNVLLFLLVLVACTHEHGEGGHTHEAPAEPERPDLSITVYQDGLELFMEYPAFVAGEPSPLVAHFTDARSPKGFKPIVQGRVTATLNFASGAEERFVAEKLLRDGIFKPIVVPKTVGPATLTLVLEGPQSSGTVSAGEVVVHPTTAAAIASATAEETTAERAFPFLKEQQWKTDYATAPVETRVLRGGVRANGELKPVAGQAAELSAPVAARIQAGDEVPHLGQAVKKNQLLVRLLPTSVASGTDLATLELEASRAKAELELAERELKRAEEMFAARAIPEKQLDAARSGREVALARVAASERQRALFRATQTGGAAGAGVAFELRSPLDGVISFADVMPGAVVGAGHRLVSVVNTEKLWLEARVYEPDAPQIERSPGAMFTVAGIDQPLTVDESNGRRVAVGTVIDRHTRTVPIIFELANPDRLLKPGMFAKVTLFTGATVRALAVPEPAIVDDSGKSVVFLMEGGESFFKRPVKTGIRSDGFVEIQAGLAEGDRVVSLGAYEIKRATSAGAMPEHGHPH